MIRLLVGLIGAVLLAGIVHIVTVFGVPRYAVADPWAEIAAFGADGVFRRLPPAEPGKATALPGLDPAMRHAICRFTLDGGPVRIKATPGDGYWILELYDRRGLPVYGIDDRAASQKAVDVLIATASQVARLRENPPEELDDIVVVDWKDRGGFALLKIFVPLASQAAEIDAALATAECRTTVLP
ncbi:DUF1254 domain-containing protein [Siculibacillus lacustris]|uniref:DUF1254 domain-containing protein n=1 Tax=Siculibacillus lacustris TaxID=1549641 RepID=A0A4Q9VZA4_9HYPH|nr:DUF1254 domain-containing protein [Siculibacillus lacustris]TBW40999.1 DUF1254 domain-containing protein [Siculibacillus lacustris]